MSSQTFNILKLKAIAHLNFKEFNDQFKICDFLEPSSPIEGNQEDGYLFNIGLDPYVPFPLSRISSIHAPNAFS
jgi:hypothetical protein